MARPLLTGDQKQEIRRKIRSAAAEVYAEQGSTNISARAVAKQAGVSVGTIYSHFGSLSELLQSLWRRPAARLVTQFESIAHAQLEPRRRLEDLLLAFVQFAEDNPSVYRNAFLFVRPEGQEPPKQISLDDDPFFRILRQAVLDGQQEGVFRDGDANALTQVVLAAVHGAIALPVNFHRLALDSGPRTPRLMIDTMLEWLESGCPVSRDGE